MLMIKQIAAQYDSWYASTDELFGGGKPVPAVRKLTEYLSGGRALDIGGGDGRNAIYLAEKGFAVSVMDLSVVGLDKLQAVAKKKGLHIKTQVADIRKENFDAVYDVMVVTYVLHHLDAADAREVVEKSQSHTVVGGVHVIVTFANEGGLYERAKSSGRFYPDEETMRLLYKDWEILEIKTEEVLCHARDKQGSRMKNRVVNLIARKQM